MNTTRLFSALLLVVGLSSCAFNQMDAASKLNETHPIKCATAEACDRLWTRLQAGIDEMTAYKLRERTATRLRQYHGGMESTFPFVFLAERVDAPDGSAVVKLDIACMNPFGCRPASEELGMSLREYIARPD